MTVKELELLLKTLRKEGVLEYEHDGIKLKLSEAPPTKFKRQRKSKPEDIIAQGPMDTMDMLERMYGLKGPI